MISGSGGFGHLLLWFCPTARKYLQEKMVSVLVSLLVTFLPPCCLADRIEIASSPNPVGSGARALGMGGAFIALADDATSASWNPGGLIQLERPEVSIVGEGFVRVEDNTFGMSPVSDGEQPVGRGGLNYLSAACPFTLLDHNMIVSLNYQHLYDFTRQWDFPLFIDDARWLVDFDQTGGLYALGLAYCVQLLPELSVGVTLNLWDDFIYKSGWEQAYRETVMSRSPDGTRTEFQLDRREHFSFKGKNVNVGLLWSVTGRWSVGLVVKTPFTADLHHTSRRVTTVRSPYFTATDEETSSDEQELDMPLSCGAGVAYRFSDRFIVTADVSSTRWSGFLLRDSKGKETSPVSGLPAGRSHISDTFQVRLGSEYFLIRPKAVVPLRCGIFYDPAPAEGRTDNFFGLSLGSGIQVGPFVFDAAYQYRFGMDVGRSALRDAGFSQDVSEHTFYTSLIIHF